MTTCQDIFLQCDDRDFYLHLGFRPSLPQVVAASYAHRYNTGMK